MTQEPDDATRRVVKKVVKKTVVRPLSPGPTGTRPAPTNGQAAASSPRRVRPARLSTPTRIQGPRATPAAPAPAAAAAAPAPTRPASPTPPAPRIRTPQPVEAAVSAPAGIDKKALKEKARKERPPKKPRQLPSLPSFHRPHLPSLPRPDVGGSLSRARYAVTDRIHDGFLATGDRIADGWHWLTGLRLPHISPLRGSAITGVLVGLLSVLFGWGFYLLFSATRGTSAGGGWGFLAIVFTAFVAFIAGELLLSGFGVPLARVISILSILLALLIVLVFFVKLVAGLWAWLIIPVVTSAAFIASNAVMRVASQQKNDQRLPWEPTSESHVKID
jgi:hypothetical protein